MKIMVRSHANGKWAKVEERVYGREAELIPSEQLGDECKPIKVTVAEVGQKSYEEFDRMLYGRLGNRHLLDVMQGVEKDDEDGLRSNARGAAARRGG